MDKFQEFYSKMPSEEIFYFENRLDDQIKWYDEKSILFQKRYKRMKFIVVLSSAMITFLVAFSFENIFTKVCIGLLGVLITSMEGLLNINKYQEHWIEYRSICETLQHEKYMYAYKSGVYSEIEGGFAFFVERIESIISNENLNWASLNRVEGGDKNV